MKENTVRDYEIEALKLKSLLTVITGFDPDNTAALPEVVEVAKMAQDIAETLYCAFADREVEKCG